MKTLKTLLLILAVLFTAGISQVNAQAVQEKDATYYFCGWLGCSNSGQGEMVCGTLYEHIVYHFDKDGNNDWTKYNYDKSEFVGQTSREVFKLFGGSNFGTLPHRSGEFNETIQLRGNMGTKAVVRTKSYYTPEGEFVMKLFFEKCI